MKPPSQWRLSRVEADALDAVIEHATHDLAALSLGINRRALTHLLGRAKHKAGAVNTLQAAIAWDRYSRPAHKEAA